MRKIKDYHINIFFSEENDGYVADIPGLRYCSAFGKSSDKALEEVILAKKAWLQTARTMGKRNPSHKYKSVYFRITS